MSMEIKSKIIKFALYAAGSAVLATVLLTTVILIISGVQESMAFFNKPACESEFPAIEVPPLGRQPFAIHDAQNETIVEATAYNVGDPNQTDATPCLAADGSNVCDELAMGRKICAANFVPIGTKLIVKGIGICTVKDRMNSRFNNRIDIAMQAHEKARAMRFGVQNLKVTILK